MVSSVRKKPMRETSSWILPSVSPKEFLARHHEVAPLSAQGATSLSIGWDEVFAIMPEVHRNGDVRYINDATGTLGQDPAVVMADVLGYGEGHLPDGFRSHFALGQYSYAIQHVERYLADVAKVADEITRVTGSAVSVTAFVSPPVSTATKIHYDKSDVYALQVHGMKRWEVFKPVDLLPNMRIPDVPFEEVELELHGVHSLSAGDVLYLPRGWIHRVRNESAEPSLHLSFVAFTDSWGGLFANLMDAAYARLRSSPEWKQTICKAALTGDAAEERLRKMLDQLGLEMGAIMAGTPARFFDHCLIDSAQRAAVDAGRQSILAASNDEEYALSASGAHYVIRHSETKGNLRVSTDGVSFHEVNQKLLERVQHPDVLRVSEIDAGALADCGDVSTSIDVLIRVTGAYRLAPLREA